MPVDDGTERTPWESIDISLEILSNLEYVGSQADLGEDERLYIFNLINLEIADLKAMLELLRHEPNS